MSRSNGIRIIAWIIRVIIIGAVVRGQAPGPNAVVLKNNQTMLDCVVAETTIAQWTRTTDGTNNPLTIASGCNVTGNNSAYYSTEQPGGNICRLIIRNATMQQAGVYDCFDGASTTYRSLVTVIDPAAIVMFSRTEVVEGDQVDIFCFIEYTGPSSPAPSLRPSPYWTAPPGQNFTSAIYHRSANDVTVIATVTVQKPTVPIFHCNTVFEITGSTTGYNVTAPADNLIVGATLIEPSVQYVPSLPSLTSRPEIIMNNGVPCGISVLTCSSTGNPSPNYRWYDSADLNVVLSTNSTLTLGKINRNYICEAYNTIRNIMSIAYTTYTVSNVDCASTVECCDATTMPTQIKENGVTIAMGVLFGMSLLVNIILMIIMVRYQRNKQTTEHMQMPEIQHTSDNSTPSAYEEFGRPDETSVQPTTYETLTLKPPLHVNQVSGNT